MSMTLTATLIAVDLHGQLIPKPTSQQLASASSLHVLAFSSHGDLLIAESEGSFSMETLEEVHEEAVRICQGGADSDSGSEDVNMNAAENINEEDVLKDTLQAKIVKERKWKESLG